MYIEIGKDILTHTGTWHKPCSPPEQKYSSSGAASAGPAEPADRRQSWSVHMSRGCGGTWTEYHAPTPFLSDGCASTSACITKGIYI